MNSQMLLEAIGNISDNYITEAADLTFNKNVFIVCRRKKLIRPLLIAALITVLLCSAGFVIYTYIYNSAIGNTITYYYTVDSATTSSPEEAAYELAVLYMNDLMTESEERTFRITEYKDLGVEVIHTTEMSAELSDIYFLLEDEISENAWIVKISVSYRFEGTISPIGSPPPNGIWIDELYQASPIDFLMTKHSDTYSLQSRYR